MTKKAELLEQLRESKTAETIMCLVGLWQADKIEYQEYLIKKQAETLKKQTDLAEKQAETIAVLQEALAKRQKHFEAVVADFQKTEDKRFTETLQLQRHLIKLKNRSLLERILNNVGV